jgi:hypothetical protein
MHINEWTKIELITILDELLIQLKKMGHLHDAQKSVIILQCFISVVNNRDKENEIYDKLLNEFIGEYM